MGKQVKIVLLCLRRFVVIWGVVFNLQTTRGAANAIYIWQSMSAIKYHAVKFAQFSDEEGTRSCNPTCSLYIY